MTTLLNVTYDGQSGSVPVPGGEETLAADLEVRRTAVELLRAGEIEGMFRRADMPADAFDQFVVDRLFSPTGALIIYLRPKVPFGDA